MATVVLKLFAGQGTVMDGWTKRRLNAYPFRSIISLKTENNEEDLKRTKT